MFPNKYSLAAIDADAWLASDDKQAVARHFVNDALWFGQIVVTAHALGRVHDHVARRRRAALRDAI